MAQVAPEIRFRIDPQESEAFSQVAERIGMDPNTMVKVFIKRAIAAGGFPFDMRTAANDVAALGERNLPIFGVSVGRISELAREAAREADAAHVAAGRLEPMARGSDELAR